MDKRHEKCVICLEPCEGKRCNFGEQDVPDAGNGVTCAALWDDISVLFILNSVFGVPRVMKETFISRHGRPVDWGIFLCDHCQLIYFNEAKALKQEIARIEQRLEDLRKQVGQQLYNSQLQEERAVAVAALGGEPVVVVKPKGGRGRKKRISEPQMSPVVTDLRKWALDEFNTKGKPEVEQIIEAAGGVDTYVAQLKAERAFKKLTGGHRLCDDSSSRNKPGTSTSSAGSSSGISAAVGNTPSLPLNMNLPESEKSKAAAAALARFEKTKKAEAQDIIAFRQAALIKEKARKQIDEEKESQGKLCNGEVEGNNGVSSKPSSEIPKKIIDPALYAVKGVFYRCSILGDDVLLPRSEMENQIREHLMMKLKDDKDHERLDSTLATACLILYSCNKPEEKVSTCVEILQKILDNIIRNPTETKYRQIRCANPSFQEKVKSVFGAEQFLEAAGFIKELRPNQNTWSEDEEEYWVWEPQVDSDFADLIKDKNKLTSTVAIKPKLDRNMQVLESTDDLTRKTELPDEFYVLSRDEIKKEQQLKTHIAERELTLRTKEMREREGIQERRLYRYAVVRVKCPDATILQGTFHSWEPLSAVMSFVRDNLVSQDLSFDFIAPGGGVFTVEDHVKTLTDLSLVPSSILNLKLRGEVPDLIASGELPYLCKPMN